MRRWLDAWRVELKDCRVILVEDSPSKTFDLNTAGYNFEHYAWDDIDRDLGGDSWIIPRCTSAVKSYGFLKAKGDITWTLDDDCFPEDHRQAGYNARDNYSQTITIRLSSSRINSIWFNTMQGTGLFPRGFPYDTVRGVSPVGIWHGLWSNIPDLDGITALDRPEFRTKPSSTTEVVPYGKLFPMCGMNLAFRPELLPVMYFMLQGHEKTNNGLKKLPFDRFDDIWAGLFAKKTADRLGYAVVSGAPSIRHTKESDPQVRVEKEAPGIAVHESLWRHIEDVSLAGFTDPASCYVRFAAAVDTFGLVDPDHRNYWFKLARAMRTWAELTA
jgi:hypothetical protein